MSSSPAVDTAATSSPRKEVAAAAAGGGGTTTVTHTPDGTTVTLGDADGDGFRTVSGGGFVADTVTVFDPQETLSITSSAAGNGTFDWIVGGAVTSGHYAPGESTNWFVNGPGVLFNGLLGDGTKLLVHDMAHVTNTNSNHRIAAGILGLRKAPYNFQLWEGGNLYAPTPSFRLQGRKGGVRPVYVGDTTITGPVDWDMRLARTEGMPNELALAIRLNDSLKHTAVEAPLAGTNWALAFSGVLASTYRTGPIEVTTLA